MGATDAVDLVAILIMAVVTYPMRVGGFWLMAHVPLTPRLRRILEALPGTVVVATIVPILAGGGRPALLAFVAAGLMMLVRRNDLLAVLAGMAAAALARAAGL